MPSLKPLLAGTRIETLGHWEIRSDKRINDFTAEEGVARGVGIACHGLIVEARYLGGLTTSFDHLRIISARLASPSCRPAVLVSRFRFLRPYNSDC